MVEPSIEGGAEPAGEPSSSSTPLLCAAFALALHLSGNPHYGFFRDELYFIMCGLRPDWGYVDQPPLAPLLAAASQAFGPSLFLLRAVPALFAAGSAYVTCLIARDLGGGRFAQCFAALTAALAPVLAGFGAKVSPDMVGLLTWPLAALFALRAFQGAHPRYWLLAGAAIGTSLQAKYSALFFALALVAGVLSTPQRRVALSRGFLAGVAIAAAIALPNFLWQLAHGLPMLELLRNGQSDRNGVLGPAGFLKAQLLITNPALAPVWLSGMAWLLLRPGARFLGVTYLFLIAEMISLHAEHDYPAAIYPVLFAAGGVAIERWSAWQRWFRPALVVGALSAGLMLLPYSMPILPVPSFALYHLAVGPLLGVHALDTERDQEATLPQDWADMHGWPELVETVARVYETLSPEERSQALIATRNYGEAAAVEFLGRPYGLPPAISGHNQYHLWGTRDRAGDTLIDVGGDCGKDLNLYRSAVTAAIFSHPHVMPCQNHVPIRVCRGRTRPLAEIWPLLKRFR